MPIVGDDPHITHLHDDEYRLHDDLHYNDLKTGKHHFVHAPFDWDLGSVLEFIPRFIVPHGDEMTYPSCLHDKYYTTMEVPRREADAVFRRFLIEEGMSKTRATLAWLAVRLNLYAEIKWKREFSLKLW